MTRITNADQVLALLRAHLQRTQRSSVRAPSSRKVRQTPLRRIQAIVHTRELSEPEIRRALIAGILEEEFGEAAANDMRFQQVVNDVLGVIEQDEDARGLLDKAVSKLKT